MGRWPFKICQRQLFSSCLLLALCENSRGVQDQNLLSKPKNSFSRIMYLMYNQMHWKDYSIKYAKYYPVSAQKYFEIRLIFGHIWPILTKKLYAPRLICFFFRSKIFGSVLLQSYLTSQFEPSLVLSLKIEVSTFVFVSAQVSVLLFSKSLVSWSFCFQSTKKAFSLYPPKQSK